MMHADLHLPVFTEQLNTVFRVTLGTGQTLPLELIQTREIIATARQECFAILLRGPLDTFLPQGTYAVSHAALGPFDLFLVPVGRGQQGFEYEAVFNRLVGQP